MMLSLEINYKTDLDVISFFPVENAVHSSFELWFQVAAASLKMKHSVLILEEKIPFPQYNDKARWDQGDHWLWLHPRSLSTLKVANSTEFSAFKSLLKNSK